MKSPLVGTATTFALSIRWAMSSTASAGIAVMYSTCRLGFAGALSVRNVAAHGAAPEPSSTVSLSRYWKFATSVPFTSTVTSLVPAPVGVIPTVAPFEVLTSSTETIVWPVQLAVYSGLYRRRARLRRAARGRGQRGAGRKAGDQRKREQGHETAKHPACSIGIAPRPLYHPCDLQQTLHPSVRLARMGAWNPSLRPMATWPAGIRDSPTAHGCSASAADADSVGAGSRCRPGAPPHCSARRLGRVSDRGRGGSSRQPRRGRRMDARAAAACRRSDTCRPRGRAAAGRGAQPDASVGSGPAHAPHLGTCAGCPARLSQRGPAERPWSRGEALVLQRIGEDPSLIGPVVD